MSIEHVLPAEPIGPGIDMPPEAIEFMQYSAQKFIELQSIYEAGVREVRARLETLDREFQVRHSHNPIHHIQSRIKTPESIARKLVSRGFPITFESMRANVKDIAGVRVVCCYTQDIYTIADMLRAQDDILVLREKDYIKAPKENGYRSLHLVVQVPVFLASGKANVPVEIQIRTVAMDFWASLEHSLRYKASEDIPSFIVDELKSCADVIAKTDEKMELIFKALSLLKDPTVR